MSNILNTNQITQIEFTQNIQCFCPLGKDFYTAQVSVSMHPDKYIPDYCEIEAYMRKLSGRDLIIEDLVGEVYEYLNHLINPGKLKVTAYVNDAAHFGVIVTKE